MCFALVTASPQLNLQRIPGGDEFAPGEFSHYSGNRQSPGVIVGYTYYDYQRSGGQGQRVVVDDTHQIHVNWMYCGGEYPGNPRFIRWNFRFPDGMWYGETDAAPSISGYCQIDIMVADPSSAKRTMNSWHYYGYPYTSIDLGSGWGSWPGDTGSPHVPDHLWPSACVASNNNIIMVTGNSGSGMDYHHLYLSTDEGHTWIHVADFDSCTCLSQFVRASRNPGSQKVVHAWTQSIAMEYGGLLIAQMANDVWYMLSNDNGVTWGRPINITKSTPAGEMANGDSTIWAFADVNTVFDDNDNLHIAFSGHLAYMHDDTIYYGDHAKLFHWDEVSDTITVICSPSTHYDEPEGWWLDISAGFREHLESWQLPVWNPQLVCDKSNGDLYCVWTGTADTTDYSAGGYFNSDIYGAYSTDHGITWSDYVNLTNTPSPGGGPGECLDEDQMTAHPYVFDDSICITFIEDKDPGFPLQEGTAWTENPVRVWVFHKGLILAIEEDEALRPDHALPFFRVYPNPFSELTNIGFSTGLGAQDVALKIYDATGRLVRDFPLPTAYSLLPTTVKWDGTDQSGNRLPAGVYFVLFNTGDKDKTQKVIRLK